VGDVGNTVNQSNSFALGKEKCSPQRGGGTTFCGNGEKSRDPRKEESRLYAKKKKGKPGGAALPLRNIQVIYRPLLFGRGGTEDVFELADRNFEKEINIPSRQGSTPTYTDRILSRERKK